MPTGPLLGRVTRLADQGGHAVTGAARAWAGALRQLGEVVPDPETAVRASYDVAAEVLRAQRDLTLEVLRVVRSGSGRRGAGRGGAGG
ncbi:hypothetical protein [Geodermatophilus marinus]|uniref:hypothetical protein n=1 Tax=Geodermatophilus sp. LHW52908 TaxID=2303986 RepID=UPI000E3E399E|nr:hypothetical protein [Geodermatophilus sp. LHW52908]RFU21986.1 hypothetical protein D0Z06_07580 [Geodermatophilus sp. LHW52908]